ncbi:MAG: hypothetical protein KDD55_02645 [Bdellovibrionales bacterium]|nr:hypothetical protein [Bdellovibrionales bacterium]
MRFCCFVNPRSGGKRGELLIRRIQALSSSPHFTCDVVEIDFRFLEQQIKNALSYDRILIAGGDGTVSAFLPCLVASKLPIVLLPLGTGNDLARELALLHIGTPSSPREWFSFYLSSPVKEVTVWMGKFESEPSPFYFINYLSFGYDGEVLCHFEVLRGRFSEISRIFGKHGNRFLYLIAGLQALFHPRLQNLTLTSPQQGVVELPKLRSLLFSNIRSVMGIGVSHPDSSPFDTSLECSLLYRFSSYFGLVAPFLRKFPLPIFSPTCCLGEQEWRIEGLPCPIWYQYDGEAQKLDHTSSLVLHPAGKVRIMCP